MMAGGRLWELAEEEIARRATWGELPALARQLGRSIQAIAGKRLKLGAGPAKRPWSIEEDREADRIIADGGGLADVAGALGRTRRSAALRRHTRRAAGEELGDVICR